MTPTPEEDSRLQLEAHHGSFLAFREVDQIDHLVRDHKIQLWELKDRDAVKRARIHQREHGLTQSVTLQRKFRPSAAEECLDEMLTILEADDVGSQEQADAWPRLIRLAREAKGHIH